MTTNDVIGRMDTLVMLQSCTITLNDMGAKVKTYSDYRPVWGKIDYSVDEQVAFGNLEAGHSISLTIYKVPSLDTRWRVVIKGEPWEITAIDTIDRLSPVCRLTRQSIKR